MTEKQILKILKENPLDIQKARASYFAMQLAFQGYTQSHLSKHSRLNPVFSYLITKNGSKYFYQFIKEQTLLDAARQTYENYLKNPNILKNQTIARKKIVKQLDIAWADYCKMKNNKSTLNKFVSIYKEMIALAHDWWGYSAIVGEDKGMIIDREIIPQFAKRHKIDENRAREIMGTLTHPKEQSILNKERIIFLKVCLNLAQQKKNTNLSENKKLQELIKEYMKNYFWMKSDFYHAQKITQKSLLTEAVSELKIKKTARIKSDLEVIDDNFSKIENEKSKLLKTIKLSTQDNKDIEFAKLVIIWQDDRKEEMMKQLYYFSSFFKDVAKRLKTTYDTIAACAPEELTDILKNGKKIYKKKEKLFTVFEKGKKPKVFFGQEADKLLAIAIDSQKGSEVKGLVSCRGKNEKIQGIARIIYDPNKQKFNDGEILVTSMTRVEFVPLMRKAKAIITDEGSIACHAAIVSRELNKPCIIGTKIATKVLKDGDYVEVDTNKGVVRIIKKYEN